MRGWGYSKFRRHIGNATDTNTPPSRSFYGCGDFYVQQVLKIQKLEVREENTCQGLDVFIYLVR
jgi:hypothetical protein